MTPLLVIGQLHSDLIPDTQIPMSEYLAGMEDADEILTVNESADRVARILMRAEFNQD